MVNDELITEAISQVTNNPIIKTKGKITLTPMSVSVINVKMPMLHNTNNIYELTFSTFQLLQRVIPMDVIHRVDHKTQKISIFQCLIQTIVLAAFQEVHLLQC